MSNQLVQILKNTETLREKEQLFFKYLSYLNKEEADFLEIKYIGMNRSQKEEFFEEIERDGIFVHQYPGFGNPQMETFKEIFTEMPEICKEYHFEGIERPMVMGEMYFIRLIISLLLSNCGKLLRALTTNLSS